MRLFSWVCLFSGLWVPHPCAFALCKGGSWGPVAAAFLPYLKLTTVNLNYSVGARTLQLPPLDAPLLLHNNGSTMPNKLSDKNLAVLGAGKLGGILLRAYLKQGLFTLKRVTATVRHEEKAANLAKELGVS